MRKRGLFGARVTAMHLIPVVMMVLGLSASSPALAIPLPGDYAFTSGLTGTFRVEGSGAAGHLTVWEINDPTSFLVHWSNTQLLPAGMQSEIINDSSTFRTSDFGHYFLTLDWSTGQWTNFHSIGQETHIGDFTYQRRADIPEPTTVLLLGVGLIAAGLMRKSVVRRRD